MLHERVVCYACTFTVVQVNAVCVQSVDLRKEPEFFVLWGKLCVVERVRVSPHVAQPDVKPRISENETEALIGQVDHPIGRRAQQTVLQEHNRSRSSCKEGQM